MTNEQFNKVFDTLVSQMRNTLTTKGTEYIRGNDKLHNFKRAAQIDDIHPLEALRGMSLKHRTSLSDIAKDITKHDKLPTRELLLEKTIDNLNYAVLEYALILEQIETSGILEYSPNGKVHKVRHKTRN